MTDPKSITSSVDGLRRDFDEAFALPSSDLNAETKAVLAILAIRVADEPYALRIAQVSGLVPNRKTIPLPTQVPELLGVSSIHGLLAPVYSLAALLDLAYDPHEAERCRWLVLCRADEALGLAFDDVEGCFQISPADLCPIAGSGKTAAYINHVIRTSDNVRPLVEIQSIVEAVKRRAGVDRA